MTPILSNGNFTSTAFKVWPSRSRRKSLTRFFVPLLPKPQLGLPANPMSRYVPLCKMTHEHDKHVTLEKNENYF